MANRIVIEGVAEIGTLPRALGGQADRIVAQGAEDARSQVRRSYPRVTGRLQDGVIVKTGKTSDPAVVEYTVLSTAPHAAPYEWGSQTHGQRARPTFLPITNRERHATTAEIIRLVEAAGFTVTGDR